MKYLLAFVVEDPSIDSASQDEMREAMERWTAFDQEAIDAGVFIACEPLQPSGTRTLRLQADGERVASDGPFLETKEQLGGFCLIDCRDADEAMEWAHKVPPFSGHIEVRPVADLSPFGYASRTPSPAAARTTA